jgi:hypothetical protein
VLALVVELGGRPNVSLTRGTTVAGPATLLEIVAVVLGVSVGLVLFPFVSGGFDSPGASGLLSSVERGVTVVGTASLPSKVVLGACGVASKR